MSLQVAENALPNDNTLNLYKSLKTNGDSATSDDEKLTAVKEFFANGRPKGRCPAVGAGFLSWLSGQLQEKPAEEKKAAEKETAAKKEEKANPPKSFRRMIRQISSGNFWDLCFPFAQESKDNDGNGSMLQKICLVDDMLDNVISRVMEKADFDAMLKTMKVTTGDSKFNDDNDLCATGETTTESPEQTAARYAIFQANRLETRRGTKFGAEFRP